MTAPMTTLWCFNFWLFCIDPQILHGFIDRESGKSPAGPGAGMVASFFLSPLKLSPSPETQKWAPFLASRIARLLTDLFVCSEIF